MREKTSPLGYYTIGIAALFLLGFLLLIIFGAQVYQDTVANQDQNDTTRALRSYLVTCTRSASADDVELKDGGADIDGQILVIRDSGTDYGLQVFLQDGQLMEVYGRLGEDPDPASAQPIAATQVFEVEQIAEGAFAVTTDEGRTLLHVRAAAGEAEAAATGDAETAAEGGGAQ